MLITFIILNLIGTTSAHINASIQINTTGNVYFDSDIHASGDVFVTIDGMDIRKEIYDLKDTRTTRGDVRETVIGMFIDMVNYLLGFDIIRYKDESAILGDALDSYFATDKDVEDIQEQIDYTNFNLGMLNVRLESVEKTLEELYPITFCQNKIKTMIKYDFYSVACFDDDGMGSIFFKKSDDAVIELPKPELEYKSENCVGEINIKIKQKMKSFDNIEIIRPSNLVVKIQKNGKLFKQIIVTSPSINSVKFVDDDVLDGDEIKYDIWFESEGYASKISTATIKINDKACWKRICYGGKLMLVDGRGGWDTIGVCED